MSSGRVSVAIPVRDGGELLAGVLQALAWQTVAHELVICDSGSSDGSLELAREHGARVIEIPPQSFNHGATRNLLMEHSEGARVAFLTQDAEPADERWLEHLLAGFELAGDVAATYGPYIPRPDAPAAVRLELEAWFASLAPEGRPSVDRLDEGERVQLPAAALVGRRGFLSDANACLARVAWERVPFRAVSYAEDRLIALDLMRAGHAKAFVPSAAVLHSHHYGPLREMRRCFDEWRALREIYGWREPTGSAELLRSLRGALGRARRAGAADPLDLMAVALHQLARTVGAQLGSHAERLPEVLRRLVSLEGRGGFDPLDSVGPSPADGWPTR